MTPEEIQKFINKVCVINWDDAVGRSKQLKDEISDIPPGELLVSTNTYGLVYKSDDKAVIILQENSELECDYTVIPIGMLKNIQQLKTKKEYLLNTTKKKKKK